MQAAAEAAEAATRPTGRMRNVIVIICSYAHEIMQLYACRLALMCFTPIVFIAHENNRQPYACVHRVVAAVYEVVPCEGKPRKLF